MAGLTAKRNGWLTGNAREELPCEILDLAVRERHKTVALKEVKDALAEQVHDDTDVPPVVEAVAQMDAPVPILLVVGFERGKHPQFNLTSIAILLHRSDDLDCHAFAASSIPGFNDFAECALAEEFPHLVYQ